MYFPRLTSIGKSEGLPEALVSELDTWLGLMPPSYTRTLLSSDFAKERAVEPHQADVAFEAALSAGLLGLVFTVLCPECGEPIVAVTNLRDLDDEVECSSEHSFCPIDHFEHVAVTYELLEKPSLKKNAIAFPPRQACRAC